MSKFKAIITGLLTTALQQVPEELAELLEKSDENEIDEKEVLRIFREKDKERVSGLKKTAHDDGYKKAEKKIKSEVEDLLKSKFEVDSDKQGEELIEEILETAGKKSDGKKGGEVTEDVVKKHPAYLSLESQLKKQEKSIKDQYEQKIQELQKQFSREKTGATVSNKALEIFEGLNPVLSTDAAKAANQKRTFVSRFTSMDWENVDGEFYAIGEDGKRKEDEHGHAITLTKLVKAEAEQLYDFKAASERSSPGEKDKGKDDGKSAYAGKLPKSQAEYEKMMNDRTIPLADRAAITDHWIKESAGEV
jgi:hypothetical protein